MITDPRSWLFIPGDSEKKLGKADNAGADAVIIDLEDAVALANKDAARDMAAAFLRERPKPERRAQMWVRVNAFDTGRTAGDVAAVIGGAPDGIVLPKSEGIADLEKLSAILSAAEQQAGIAAGSTRIMPVATETARAVLKLNEFTDANISRLQGISWGAEDLGTAVGAIGNRLPDGRFYEAFRMVRSLTLFAAHAAGAQAIDTLMADFRDEAALKASSEWSYREGFTGRLAIHPAQVEIINAAYLPTEKQVDDARAIIAAFEDVADGAGTVQLEGKMVDRPHLVQAGRLISRWNAFQA